jgi:ANTAR domain/PAS fold
MSSPTLSRQRPSTRQPRPAGAPTSPPSSAETDGSRGRLAARYRYDRRTSTWWWSPEMFDLYGLRPGSAEACTEVLLHHQHPDDRPRTLEALTGACTAGQPFTLQNRIVRADGEQRTVVLLGDPELEPTGGVSAVEGVCIDITGTDRPPAQSDRIRALEAEVEQLKAAMTSRATIEQAKGILMLLTSCGDQVAFDLLAHISSHTHRKVRDVAQSITESAHGAATLPDDVCAIIRDACPPAPASR